MPIIHNEMDVRRSITSRPVTPLKENGMTSSAPSQMIRVDYQKKNPSATPSPVTPLSVDTSTTSTPHHLQADRNSTSPVSSIQEEFYSYLGISSKSSGDSDADADPQTATTTPTKSPLDDFDISKRRSLRVRVVNKMKEHQAKMQKIASESTTNQSAGSNECSPVILSSTSLSKEAMEGGGEFSKERKQSNISSRRTSRLGSQCSSNGMGGGAAGDPSPNTILARRCYALNRSDPSPSPTPSNSLLPPAFTSSPLFMSPEAARATTAGLPSNLNPRVEIFNDFEEEIKKHVQLTSREEETSESSSPPSSQEQQPSMTQSQPTPSPVQQEEHPKPVKSKGSSKKASKIITQRIIIRRKTFAPTVAHRKQRERANKWDAINNNKRKLKIPNATVELKKFRNPSPPVIEDIDSKASATLPLITTTTITLPEFTLVQKVEEVPPYTVLDVPVQKEPTPGPILGTYYNERQRILLVVTEKKVAFFQHHTTVAMFSKVVPPTAIKNGHIHNAKPRSMWSQIDSVDRMTRDQVVDELMFEKRIMVGDGGKYGAYFVYVELRGQPLRKDRDYRTGEMCAAYVNVYYLSRGGGCDDDEEGELSIEAKTIALDTIVAMPQDISYAILPQDRTLVMCWTERQHAKKKIGICKYTLSEDFSTMTKAEEFQSVDGEINGLRWDANYVIGTGNNQISIWDNKSGRLLSNIVLTDFELGDTIHANVLNVDKHEKHLLLVQYWQNYLNVVHVNLLDYAYRVLKSRELNCTREAVQSVVRLDVGDGANVILGLVARGGGGEKGEAPHEMLEMFDALTNRLVVMQRNGLMEVDGGMAQGCSRLFLNERYLIKVGDRLTPETISIQPVSEFLFNLI